MAVNGLVQYGEIFADFLPIGCHKIKIVAQLFKLRYRRFATG
jgi:hypothetical protein